MVEGKQFYEGIYMSYIAAIYEKIFWLYFILTKFIKYTFCYSQQHCIYGYFSPQLVGQFKFE